MTAVPQPHGGAAFQPPAWLAGTRVGGALKMDGANRKKEGYYRVMQARQTMTPTL
jgi:hypothetical protein